MSKTPLRHRIFAGMGAALFLVTASALTIAVVYDMVTNKNSNNTTSTSTASTCIIDATIATSETLAAPEVYKPSSTVSSLESTDIEKGSGATAKAGDCLQMKYYGTLADSGTEFDENYTKATLLQFKLGASQVITGWDQGVVGMKVGGTRRLVIPPSLGYGAQASGSIPANSTLVFVVKLVIIKN